MVYADANIIDFVDCILASHCIVEGKELLSFDRKLNSFIAKKLQKD